MTQPNLFFSFSRHSSTNRTFFSSISSITFQDNFSFPFLLMIEPLFTCFWFSLISDFYFHFNFHQHEKFSPESTRNFYKKNVHLQLGILLREIIFSKLLMSKINVGRRFRIQNDGRWRNIIYIKVCIMGTHFLHTLSLVAQKPLRSSEAFKMSQLSRENIFKTCTFAIHKRSFKMAYFSK